MNYFYNKNEQIYVSNNSNEDDIEDSGSSGYEEEEEEEDELHCKNLDPALAKLMGIVIEEQKNIDWKPPMKSGLDNSEKIISNHYFSNHITNENKTDYYFMVIKEDITNYKTLSNKQLEYINYLTNEQKFELIQIYNKITKNKIP